MKKILVFLAFLYLTFPVQAQTEIPKAQAMFIYNFSRLIEWPVSYRSGPFVIGILGSSSVADALEVYAAGKKVGTQDINIIRYKTYEELNTCHILFIPFSRTKQLAEIQQAVQGKNVLLITEKNGALNAGAGINFVLMSNKIRFEMQPENITKYGLKYSSKLQEMAKSGS
ncbi:MAG: YfiR family protein [Bacteroidales bacterium]|nr:YfiR family protein [Bacteroidales bacterium]MBN2763320.1 YfiR family protein [Bacteroidales bacterium]